MFDDKYKFKLDNFEGPLDLLLHLIKEAKMDIADVKLADITEQYLDYMQGLEELDMERATEFITVAATLIEIKSKSLLPRPEENLPDEVDEEKLLLERLKEYQIFKEASQDLKKIEDIDKLYKAPDSSVGAPRFVLKDMVLDKATHILYIKKEKINLTKTEYVILKQLLLNPKQIITKTKLIQILNEYNKINPETQIYDENSLKVHISNIRKKIRNISSNEYIESVWGIGFKLYE